MKARFVPSRASHLTWVLAALLTGADFCYADSSTLLRWGAAPEVEGGPDLDAPLVTDRPDFTEASSTVGLGVAQLEVGYTYASDDDGTTSTQSHSFPEALFRLGMITEWLEFRLGGNYAGVDDGFVESSGAEDLYFGFKVGLTPQAGFLPEMALVPQMTAPTGHHAFTADECSPRRELDLRVGTERLR